MTIVVLVSYMLLLRRVFLLKLYTLVYTNLFFCYSTKELISKIIFGHFQPVLAAKGSDFVTIIPLCLLNHSPFSLKIGLKLT